MMRFWKVQSIDQSFVGSALSSEGEFFFRPTPPVMNDTIIYRCGNTIRLTAGGQQIEWFSDEDLTSKVSDGTFSPSQSGNFYVTQTIDGVRGIPNKVYIEIYVQPETPTILTNNPLIICDEPSDSQAYLGASGTDLSWYTDLDKTQLIGNQSWISVPMKEHKYYVTQTLQHCESKAAQVSIERITIDTTLYYDNGRVHASFSNGDNYYWFKNNQYVTNTSKNYLDVNENKAEYKARIVKGPCSKYTETFNVTSVEQFEDNSFQFYPNPTYGPLDIHINEPGKTLITISDARGELRYQRYIDSNAENELRLSVESWTKGVYLVQIVVGDRRITKKLIVL